MIFKIPMLILGSFCDKHQLPFVSYFFFLCYTDKRNSNGFLIFEWKWINPCKPTSDKVLSLPEIGYLGCVVVIDCVHSNTAVFQPVGCGDPSSQHSHGSDFDFPVELQDHHASDHLSTAVHSIIRTVQLKSKEFKALESHNYDAQNMEFKT